MHMEYEVRLPDHKFIVAPMHKLILSVIGAMENEKRAVTCSGPTYVESGVPKHSQTTALHHLQDMKSIRSLDEFSGSFKTEGNDKPVMIVRVDGGPDENSRYMKTMECAMDYFLTYDLDALLIATKRVERRMASLNKEMTGLILDHKYFGTHLNNKDETIDKKLELKVELELEL